MGAINYRFLLGSEIPQASLFAGEILNGKGSRVGRLAVMDGHKVVFKKSSLKAVIFL